MLGSSLNKNQLLKETRRLRRNVYLRAKNIEGAYVDGRMLPQDAVTAFKSFKQEFPKIGKTTDIETLRSAYREITYINQLKTSTFKGAKAALLNWTPLSEKLKALSKSKQDEFWGAYNRLYTESRGMIERFKYDVFSELIDTMYEGEIAEDVIMKFIDSFENSIRKGSTKGTDYVGKLFVQNIKKLRGKFD